MTASFNDHLVNFMLLSLIVVGRIFHLQFCVKISAIFLDLGDPFHAVVLLPVFFVC